MPFILLATDGSEHSTAAARLVGSIPWPPETTIGVVSVVPSLRELSGLPWSIVAPADLAEVEASELARVQRATWTVVDALREAGLRAHCRVMRGHPARSIVGLAERLHADLIVVGSRGLGTVESALVGSVSAELIDRAPCPVLVARTETLGHTIIADDGTTQAELARAYVRERPHLLGHETRLVGVAPLDVLWADSLAPLDARTVGMLADSQSAVREGLAERLAADAADTLADGVPGTTEVREGSVANEILAAGKAFDASLIVVGSHGRHGLNRLAIGSVSRSIVQHAACSVLVVRGTPAKAVEADRPAEVAGIPSGGGAVATKRPPVPPVFPTSLP